MPQSPYWHLGVIALLLQATHGDLGVTESFLSPLRYGNASVDSELRVGLGAATGIGSMKHPGFASYIKRQEECNPGYIPCGDGVWCHPEGTECCSDGAHNCPVGNTCCIAEGQCAEPGYSCCKGKSFTCPTGGACCPMGDLNCAPPGGSCCGEMYCLEDEKCCSSEQCAPSSSVCCGEGYCDEGQTCCGNGLGCANEGYVCCEQMKYSCPQGSQCCKDDHGPYCGTPKCLPTLRFPHVPGITDELQENTCEGLKDFLKRNGKNEFDWNGPGSRSLTEKQRRAAGCGGGLTCPPGQNCDEFPMASTSQGGAGASIRCVPDWLNGFYGYIWSSWLREQRRTSGFRKGTKFRIIVDDCDLTDLRKSKAKRASNSIVLNTHDGLTIFNGSWFGNFTQSNNVVFMPLTPDVGNAGTYSLNYSLTGGQEISSGWIMDEYGEPYETLGPLQIGTSNSTTFQLEDAGDGPVYFFGWTKAKDVEMSFTVKSPPPSSSTSISLQPTSTTTVAIRASSTNAASATRTASMLLYMSFLAIFI